MDTSKVKMLSDEELMTRLGSLCAEDCRLKAEIVAYLAEVEERRIHLRAACSSMLDFCLRKLKMSKGVAFRRINAARLVRKFPCFLPGIATGDIHLETLLVLRDHLTVANAEELLAAVRGKSVPRIEELLAARAPKPDIPARIVPLVEQSVLPRRPRLRFDRRCERHGLRLSLRRASGCS